MIDSKIRLRLLEILKNEGFPAPIIVFVNQKKTADMVCKDVQRGGVSPKCCRSAPVLIDINVSPFYLFFISFHIC